MKGQTLQVRVVGGMAQDLPQPIESASIVDNWIVDPGTQGFSSRIGYEKYRPDAADKFNPFNNLGRIDSIFVAQGSPNGARQSILFETLGTLYLFYEVGQENVIVALASLTPPTATDAPTTYTQWNDRVIVTNGRNAPLIIRLWPLSASADITDSVKEQIVRPLGFGGRPTSPEAYKVLTINATGSGASATTYTGKSTSNWYPVYGNAISFPNAFGMGTHAGGSGGEENNYQFKVSFISDTGSVSPLSTPVQIDWEIDPSAKGFRYCPTMDIPLGPDGTVARRMYGTFDDGEDFYFIADVRNNVETLFHATRRSKTFTTLAPSDTNSAPFPAKAARFASLYKQCVFLDGGRENGSTLYFSNPGFPDEYGAVNFITLSGGGGDITGLYAYYNLLLIFRESSIDVLTGNFPNFSVQTITKQVSCRAPSTIEAVPGLGLVFLATDGVYALTGGLDGGSVVNVVPLGIPIRRELTRLTVECAQRAVGRYSTIERAYHLYIPVDGDDRPSLGLVYHLEKKGWSIRTGFPVGCIDRLHNGTMVFGHNTGNVGSPNDESGLFVISATPAMGGSIVGDTYQIAGPPTSTYQSAWHDFGDSQIKKQVQYVTLWVQTRGEITVDLSFFKDFEYSPLASDTRFVYQPPDRADQPVYDSAVVGTDAWQDAQLVPLRVPVAVQSCSWFKFQLQTTNDVIFVGYEIEYVSRGTTTIAGKRA
jgi:hypothetical protein